MNQHGIFKKWLWAGVMGILTILLCLIVSDDLLGLNSPPARSHGAGRGPHRRRRYPLRPCQPAGGPGMGHAA